MNAQIEQPALAPTLTSLRQHFEQRTIDKPEPMNNPDSLAFKGLHEEQGSSAAVLIPIVPRAEGLQVLLTRRADHLKHHPGQVSFPGGRIEAHDQSPTETALRESEEEIGLAREKTEVLGEIGSVYTVTAFHVTPIIGVVEEPLNLQPDPNEVADVLLVPLNFLMDPGVYERHQHQHDSGVRTYFSTYYLGQRIWGVTAGIIMGMYEELCTTHLGQSKS